MTMAGRQQATAAFNFNGSEQENHASDDRPFYAGGCVSARRRGEGVGKNVGKRETAKAE
ncbi:MAG: hypothetical protein M0R22_07340 [Dehalococcoidia bacterium]|nr:hypothetical protein [Dehalococcoidia bacterium]